ncbi:hypothetical protein H4582DRAFT_2011887 [Lactarius indigo]|nr:hypothetical protein H4582DRAFT_2011887 [Lactarius indigo]
MVSPGTLWACSLWSLSAPSGTQNAIALLPVQETWVDQRHQDAATCYAHGRTRTWRRTEIGHRRRPRCRTFRTTSPRLHDWKPRPP